MANIAAVMREVRRVLRDDGTCWLNLGDVANASGTGRNFKRAHPEPVAVYAIERNRPTRSLMGQPWRVAAGSLRVILRSAIVWHKPNPMLAIGNDRPTNAYEMVPWQAGRYFYDAEAVGNEVLRIPLDCQKLASMVASRVWREEGGHDSGLQSFRESLNGEHHRSTPATSGASRRRAALNFATDGFPGGHPGGQASGASALTAEAPWVSQVQQGDRAVGCEKNESSTA